MNLLETVLRELYDTEEDTLYLPDGIGVPITPVVAYLCFEGFNDLEFSKTLNESSNSKSAVRKEYLNAKLGRTSKETGTVYKLTPEQKRALKLIKKKYGKVLTKEIKKFRQEFLAPYQIIKNNMEKSKSLYPKEVFGMTKEEYLRNKKRAENKIENMRNNNYAELNRKYYELDSKEKEVNDTEKLLNSGDKINSTALRKVFEKFDIYSNKFSENDFNQLKRKTENINYLINNIIHKIENNEEIPEEETRKIVLAIREVQNIKKRVKKNSSRVIRSSDLSSTMAKQIEDLGNLKDTVSSIEIKLNDLSIPDNYKDEALDDIDDITKVGNEKITGKSFSDEYEMYLLRQRILDDIRKGVSNKYTDEYKKQLAEVKGKIVQKKDETIGQMAKSRSAKKLTPEESKIYELKPGAPKDSDNLKDYILKIKEEDFFDPMFFEKSEKTKEAEKKIDAEIKRFERSLESKMDPQDFKLLKKYRLINNLITIKNLKDSKKLFDSKEGQEI